MKIAISSGHGKYISGAVGPKPWGLNEHAEAVKVVNRTAELLRAMGVGVWTFEDTTSRDQNTNLHTIVDWHNSRGPHDLDVSVHFNCNVTTENPVGCEVLYVSSGGREVADETVDEICIASGLKNRGPKERTDLFFLNNTNEVAILIETCFVDSHADVDIYHSKFDAICEAIARAISGEAVEPAPEPPPSDALFQATGKCSWFGGPNDTGVAPDEGLAFIYSVDQAPQLFLPSQPPGTSGLARRLDPDVFYVACRWDYAVTSKDMLADPDLQAVVRAGGREFKAWPADWGPNQNTGRVADLSPGLLEALGLETDDQVEVIYPVPAAVTPAPEPEPATVNIQISASGPVTVIVNGTPIGEI